MGHDNWTDRAEIRPWIADMLDDTYGIAAIGFVALRGDGAYHGSRAGKFVTLGLTAANWSAVTGTAPTLTTAMNTVNHSG